MLFTAWPVVQVVLLFSRCGGRAADSIKVIKMTPEFVFLYVFFLSSDGLWRLT